MIFSAWKISVLNEIFLHLIRRLDKRGLIFFFFQTLESILWQLQSEQPKDRISTIHLHMSTNVDCVFFHKPHAKKKIQSNNPSVAYEKWSAFFPFAVKILNSHQFEYNDYYD